MEALGLLHDRLKPLVGQDVKIDLLAVEKKRNTRLRQKKPLPVCIVSWINTILPSII
jgi:hypothetical protein